jgi:hypothetical protein
MAGNLKYGYCGHFVYDLLFKKGIESLNFGVSGMESWIIGNATAVICGRAP